MILFFNAFKYYLKVSNSWIVQPQTVQKKLYAPLTSPNIEGKNIIFVNILLQICFTTFLMCKNSKISQTQCILISSKQS